MDWKDARPGIHQTEYLYQGYMTVAFHDAVAKFGPEVGRTVQKDGGRSDHIAKLGKGVLVMEEKNVVGRQVELFKAEGQALRYLKLVDDVAAHQEVTHMCFVVLNFIKGTQEVRLVLYQL